MQPFKLPLTGFDTIVSVKPVKYPQSYFRERYAELIALVESGVPVPKASRMLGMCYRNATYVLNRAGYKRKWVKVADDGSEEHLDAWE